MNNERRKLIEKIKSSLDEAKESLVILANDADDLSLAERDAFDALPEGLQQTERGQQAEAAADALETAKDEIESAIDSLDSAISSLEDASGAG